MKKSLFLIVALFFAGGMGLKAKETNVLVIVSTKPYGDVKGIKSPKKSTLISSVKNALMRNLKSTGKINVEFEDVYRTKKLNTAVGGRGGIMTWVYQCHSLAQWFFWPEGRDKRLANLEGKEETKWDYIVLIGDSYIMEQMPGVYAEGVKLIDEQVRKGSAKTILFLPWQRREMSKAEGLVEVVYRVGKSSDIPVLPRMTVAKVKKYLTGTFDKENVFAMKYLDKRDVTYNHTGTSSERGIEGGLRRAANRCRINMRRTQPDSKKKIDFNYGRANTMFEPNKKYKVNPKLFDRSYGFPMQDHSKTAAETMLYGIDKRGNDDGTDLGIALDMINQKEVPKDIRCIPIRLMWAKLQHAAPEMKPLRDRWHMSNHLDSATGSFIYTLLSGRCPVGPKPTDPNNKNALNEWLGQKIGYETAWRMGHINGRVPGFTVRPQDKNLDLKSGQKTTMEVRFQYPPKSDVTVSIKVDKEAAAGVEPSTLKFTPENYNEIQKVTVVGSQVDNPTPFKVQFSTKSEDNVFDKLKDAWPYTSQP